MSRRKKILVIKLRAMGDTILTTAACSALKEVYGAEVHCLVPRIWAPLLENHQDCDRILRWQPRGNKLIEAIKLLPRLRCEKYDIVVALHAASTTAFIARWCGALVRAVHFHGLKDVNKHSTVDIAGKGEVKPILERDLDTLRALGKPIEKAASTSVVVTAQEKEWASSQFEKLGLVGPVLALGLGASRPTKMWPVEKYVDLARQWSARTGGSVLGIAGPAEMGLAVPLSNEGVFVRCGGDIRESAALISNCDLFVGNDSGPKHLAVALGVKTITLFGPENPYEWHPYDRKEHPVCFKEGLSCRKPILPGTPDWCGIAVCEEFNHRCMKEISVEEVVAHWPQQFQNS